MWNDDSDEELEEFEENRLPPPMDIEEAERNYVQATLMFYDVFYRPRGGIY